MKLPPLLAFFTLGSTAFIFAADAPTAPPGDAAKRETSPQIIVKVLALDYDPKFEGKLLHEVFNWGDPKTLAKGYIDDMEKAAGGLVKYEIAEWRYLDEIYAREDGGRFTIEEYVRNRREGKGWPKDVMADYPRIMAEQKVVPMVDMGLVDEVWIFSDHFFGVLEASMAGPGAFFINGGVYPQVPSKRPFAFYGFNYERGVAEMMHDASHRTECTMNRIYGEWNLKDPKNNWEKFSANNSQSNGVAGVGTCHWPANAMQGYDYGNLRKVDSWADDFLHYPNLTGKTAKVSVATWSDGPGDHHRNYMRWYFEHLPRAPGVNPDGKLNNWWRYLYDFTNYTKEGKPRPPSALVAGLRTSGAELYIAIAYCSPASIDPSSFDVADVALRDARGAEFQPASVAISDMRPGGYRVAIYRFNEKSVENSEACTLALHARQVSDLAKVSIESASWDLARKDGAWQAASKP